MRQVYDSDGRRCRQLVKSGNDDMRQDAVMQQFFQLVNVLLATDPCHAPAAAAYSHVQGQARVGFNCHWLQS